MGKTTGFVKKLVGKSFEYSIHISFIALAVAVIFGDLFFLGGATQNTAWADSTPVTFVDAKKVDALYSHLSRIAPPLEIQGDSHRYTEVLTEDGGFLSKPMLTNTIISGLPRENITTYKVIDGDTYWTIAYKFEITIDTLRWANNIEDLNGIKSGQELIILPVNGLLHNVAEGDTVGSMATFYGVAADSIVSQNKLASNTLTLGQRLIIPGAKRFSSTKILLPVVDPNVLTYEGSVTPGTGSFAWPLTSSERFITQYFTWVTPYYKHTGIDLDFRNGLDILASDRGTVVSIGSGWSGGYGKHIVVDHGNGYQTLYSHLSSIGVQPGQTVEKGQKIGIMGSTGRSTGTHLHFEIRFDGRAVNPLAYIK
ncbi:peptidoglycan DD-metalloendopeptidase family protein [Candidatus Microgenomates bacterium]|nr:peptidoglycan DD-metalloendopeptidase family protein [Candidatus Microgenomates bacterium]